LLGIQPQFLHVGRGLEDALRLDPNHFRANLFLGRMLVNQQSAATALLDLRNAVKLRPDAIDGAVSFLKPTPSWANSPPPSLR